MGWVLGRTFGDDADGVHVVLGEGLEGEEGAEAGGEGDVAGCVEERCLELGEIGRHGGGQSSR